MMFRYTFARADVADRIEAAVRTVLAAGLRTGDIALPGERDDRHAGDGRRGGGGTGAEHDPIRLQQARKVMAMRVGFVGWRGMVGSVLMQRMREERDFEHIDPVFFSTSHGRRQGPGDRQGHAAAQGRAATSRR